MAFCYVKPENQRFAYTDFVRDLRDDPNIPYIHYPIEYNGEKVAKLCCSQHLIREDGTLLTDAERRRITAEWIDFFEFRESSNQRGSAVYCHLSKTV